MTLFVDSSAFYAFVDLDDRNSERARDILTSADSLVTTDHVLVESWLLIQRRLGGGAAERFWEGLRTAGVTLESVGAADLEVAWAIGEEFRDQEFSIVDRTSFAVMQRLGVFRAAAFDDHFAVFRFGRRRERAFEVLR